MDMKKNEKDTNNIKDKQEKELSNEKKQSQSKKGIVTIVIVIAIILTLAFSVYKFYLGNPKRIVTNSIDSFSGRWEKLIKNYPDDDFDYGQYYTATSKLTIDASSDTLETLATTAPEYEMYNNIINNLKKLDTSIVTSQSKKDKKMFIKIDSKLQDEDIININYLVQNNKQYYLVKGLFDNYVDGGENKYFENLEDSESTIEDMQYVYDLALESLKKNLKDDYFTEKSEKIKVQEKEINARKVILTIDDKASRELAQAILKDLKKSKKATKILEKVNPNFKDAKIEEEEEIFGEGEEICYIAYVDKLTYKNLMQKIEINNKNESIAISHEETNDKDKDYLNVYENDNLIGTITIEEKEDGFLFGLKNSSKENIGTLSISKKDKETITKFDIEIEGLKITFNINSVQEEIKKAKEYKTESKMDLKVESEGEKIIDLKMDVNSNIVTEANIEEKIDNATSSSAINQEKLQEYMMNIILKLAS